MDSTVIGNSVFPLSRDLSFPYHMINGTKSRVLSFSYHMINRTKVIAVRTVYSVTCNICKFNIEYQNGLSFVFTMIINSFCCGFYPWLVLECVCTQVVMASLSDVKRLLSTR